MAEQINPHEAMLIVKSDGREVGRIAVSAKNADAYVTELGRTYGAVQIEIERDPDAAMISRMISGGFRG